MESVTVSVIPMKRSWAESFKIKMVEPLRMTTRAEREAAIAEAYGCDSGVGVESDAGSGTDRGDGDGI